MQQVLVIAFVEIVIGALVASIRAIRDGRRKETKCQQSQR